MPIHYPGKTNSWVVGVEVNGVSKAYDWIDLKAKRVIHHAVGSTPIAVALASDDQTFVVIERMDDEEFIIRNDSLVSRSRKIDFAGRVKDAARAKVIKSYQEYWHSWKEFHPETQAPK